MKRHVSNKILVCLILLICIGICMFVYYILHSNNLYYKKNNNKYNLTDFINNVNEEKICSYFKNREAILDENVISIGKNKKEIENGYYDIRFCFMQDGINIYLNKLIKDDISENTIQEEYLEEIVYFLMSALNEENLDMLKQSLYDEYSSLRKNKEFNEDNLDYKSLEMYSYAVKFNIENNMLKVEIKLGGDV